MADLAFLGKLEEVIAERLAEAPEGSYTAALARQGIVKIAQKLGEEGIELALAAAAESDARVTEESADLLFHLFVLLSVRGIPFADVLEELTRRHR
jgi:phosphoribosyl-ATP pyrophosphohydrolase/phosphoribosyl-AMP cyclohydrolase